MDGFEFVRRFRQWETEEQSKRVTNGLTPWARFRFIGMSANSDAQSRQDALDAGMDYFVVKPFTYDDIKSFLSFGPSPSDLSSPPT